MCPKPPKIKEPTEYSPALAPEMPDTEDTSKTKGRRATLLTAGDTQAAPTSKKTLLGQ